MEDWRKSKTSFMDKLVHYLSNKKDKVAFSVGGAKKKERIEASVDILSTLSPVFETMFDDKWKGQNEKVIPLSDCQPKAFRLFLEVFHI